MLKQPIQSEHKALEIQFSLQKLGIISRILILENQANVVDTDFKIANINNFARRIGQDCYAIEKHLTAPGRFILTIPDENFYDEYAAEIWRVIDVLAGQPLDDIKAYADDLDRRKVTA